jgi:hypothetical protein
MEIADLTLTGLVALGTVNVIGLFKPGLDSRVKFGISFLTAFLVAFIPTEMGIVILDNAKIALQASLGASGVYKLATKAGGDFPGD